jgi:hypothetical protein
MTKDPTLCTLKARSISIRFGSPGAVFTPPMADVFASAVSKGGSVAS